MNRIALCESGNRADAANPNSSARGRFQFLSSSWEMYGKQLWGSTKGKSVLSYKDNTDLARFVIEKYGAHDWDSSAYCWK